MFELMFCATLTILPDYLFRRFFQGKRFGQEITLYSVWYELRIGITACAILTVSLITMIFYYHPSTTNVASFFRTVTILPEAGGRVSKIYVRTGEDLAEGDPLFDLDASTQEANLLAAQNRVAEIDASIVVTASDLAAAQGAVGQAEGSRQQAQEELNTKQELFDLNSDIVSTRELERLTIAVETRQGAVDAALANQQAVQARIDVLLPAQKKTAEADLQAAEVALAKTKIVAGVDGRLDQFALKVGDFVSPVLRPAGLLIPADSGIGEFSAGFHQLSAQVIQPGMLSEITCLSLPFKIIPMVVTAVQPEIAAGQFRPGDSLVEISSRAEPGTIGVTLKPLYEDHADAIPPGSKCIANAYTSTHHLLDDPDLSTPRFLFLHVVGTVGVLHAALLRVQSMLLPVRTLVFTGH